MPTTHTARNAPTFLNLPPEIRCMIYEEVFTRVRIILPARHALHRSEHLKSKLPSLLRVCRQCHVESSSILYSNAVMDVTASVTTETIDRALQNKNINLIKTLIVHGGYLKRMLGAHQKTRFPALEELIVRSDFVVLMFGGTGERSIRDVCRSEWAILMQQQANCGLDWSAHRGFSLHITFETYKGKSTYQDINYSIDHDVFTMSPTRIEVPVEEPRLSGPNFADVWRFGLTAVDTLPEL